MNEEALTLRFKQAQSFNAAFGHIVILLMANDSSDIRRIETFGVTVVWLMTNERHSSVNKSSA
jgi:hypothetical protein